MKVQEWLRNSTSTLGQSNIPTARLDCLVLLEDATGKDRAWLLAHPEFTVQGQSLYVLEQQILRRAKHEPLAYIRGKSEFYGREFKVSKDTLEPRPETETMIDMLINLTQSEKLEVKNIIDVGTGSGALAITAKFEYPDSDVMGVDISEACLKIARQNAQNHQVDVKFCRGDLLQAVPDSSFSIHNCIILANLPYVPDGHTINQAAMFEPSIAIFGGVDGLDYYRRLFDQVNRLETRPEYVFTESLPFQHTALKKIGEKFGYQLFSEQDFIQSFKLND